MSTIALKIKQLRAKSGLTQDGFAEALGEKPSKIRDIESGRQRVNDQFVAKLVEIFPVDLNWLFSLNDEGETQPPIGPADGNKPLSGDVQIFGQDYNAIKVYEIEASAGNGIVPAAEEAAHQVAFTRSWLIRHGIAADLAGLVRVKGDSMAPTIPDGAWVLVDFRAHGDWSSPGIYIVRHEGAILIKRLQRPNGKQHLEGWVVMISDNLAYPPLVVHTATADDFQPIARVRMVLAPL
ncbi:Predicted transcriptional regulator [Maritimibacter sp. HL-12]|nr:Predicted transcriptional regulator [Maritimibacter sp. HL-12]